MLYQINNETEAYVHLIEMGCKIEDSKTSEFCHMVTPPNGPTLEVWSREIVSFAQNWDFSL